MTLAILLIIPLVETPVAAQTAQERMGTVSAEQLLEDGYRLFQQGTKESLREALGKFEQALSLSRTAGDKDGVLLALSGIGRIYADTGEKRKALEYLTQVLPLLHAGDDRGLEATMLTNVAKIHSELGERQQAVNYYERALPLLHALGDPGTEAAALNSLGGIYSAMDEGGKALDYYTRALPLRRAAGDRTGEAAALSNIAGIYSSSGEGRRSLDYYAQALSVARAAGDRVGEEVTLTGMGKVYSELGEKEKALDIYTKALPIARAADDRIGEAILLNNIGGNYAATGEAQKALDYYTQALALARSAGLRDDEATSLNNLGLLYSGLGESQKALDLYTQALPLWRASGDRRSEAITLNNIGVIYTDMGEERKAIEYLQQALRTQHSAGYPSGEARTLGNLGSAYYSMGDKAKALEYHLQALPIFRATGDRQGEAQVMNNIGVTYAGLGEKEKALDYHTRALPLRRATHDRAGEALTLYNIARLARDRGALPEARVRAEEAIVILEGLRTKIADQQLRSSYFATVQDYYELYIDILMRLHRQQPSGGFDGLALQAVERSRARVLLETLAEAGADIRQGADPALLGRERSVRQRLDAAARRQLELPARAHAEAQATAIAAELAALTSDLQQVETEIRQKSPRYAALTQPRPLSTHEIQSRVLDTDTLLLEYSLGVEGSYLFAVTKDSITSYELPKRAEIEEAARQTSALLTSAARWRQSTIAGERQNSTPSQGTPAPGNGNATMTGAITPAALAQLSRMVIAPVADRLGEKRLVIVADGALQFIPFSALTAPSGSTDASIYHPLIIDHEIISLPSASTLAVLRDETKDRRPAPKTLAVLADPVFDSHDARVQGNHPKSGMKTPQSTERGLGLASDLVKTAAVESGVGGAGLVIPPLPGTRLEAEGIMRLTPPGESEEALGFKANRATATGVELGQYRYVHFATHGFLNSRHPELSGLVFSMVDEEGRAQDGFLRAHEVFNLRLQAEMVVLSACETGLGKEVRGEGLIGLTRGFMYAGAPRVVVSLWSVNDASTAELMTRFYEGILLKKMSPAQALRVAQVSLLKGGRYGAPFYWAAFILQGEWK